MTNSSRNRTITKKGDNLKAEENYSSPLPPSDEVSNYEKILAGSAERILKMTETQAKHRQRHENTELVTTILLQCLGLLIGGILCIGCLVLAYISIKNNQLLSSSIFGAIGMGPILIAFIKNLK